MSSLSLAFRNFKKKRRVERAKRELSARMRSGIATTSHGLDRPLIVSLTSYERRFATLTLTLNGILHQSVRPDHVILWLTREDRLALPQEVRAMETLGLEIAVTEDIRSYKKIIPALRAHPEAYILTLDDDVYYGPNTIEQLAVAQKRNPTGIACHRAHGIRLTADGLPAPYRSWNKHVELGAPSPLIFPTGVMGILYPPAAFHEDVADVALFTELCPTADDVWLYWMWRLRGRQASQFGKRTRIVEWPGSQETALRHDNLERDINDHAIRAMIKRYGFPRD